MDRKEYIMIDKKTRKIFLNLLKSGQILELITEEVVGMNTLFNTVFDPPEEVRNCEGDGHEQAPLIAKSWFIHVKALGILVNRMMVSSKVGKTKKFNSKSMMSFIETEPLFKLHDIPWSIACIATLIRNNFIKMEHKDGYTLYKLTRFGKELAIEEASSVVEDPNLDLNEAASQLLKDLMNGPPKRKNNKNTKR